jgi:glycosyltransferase involved in cell wall biosynthesis
MKLLSINTFYKYGSTGRIVYDLQRIHKQFGIDSYVAYGDRTNNEEAKNVICLQGWWRRKWNILKTRLFAQHGFYNITETKRLIKYIDEVKPDIIHLHNIHNHYVNVEMLFDYIKKHDIPVVWTLHDCWPFTGWCAYFDYAQCDKWKIGCHHCPSKHDYPFTWFFDKSESNYHDDMIVSAFEKINNKPH